MKHLLAAVEMCLGASASEVSRRWGISRQSAYRAHYKLYCLAYKGMLHCQSCNYFQDPLSLHFHHVDRSTKKFNVNSKSMANWEEVKLELDKCVVLCPNCHAFEHRMV